MTQLDARKETYPLASARSWARVDRFLDSVVGLAEMLRDRSRDVSAAARNEMIDQLAMHARALECTLDHLIVATNLREGEVRLATDPVDLRELVADVSSVWTRERGTQITVSGGVEGIGDKVWLAYALESLLEDAFARGARRINVQLSEGYSKAIVAIDDDGDDIPAEERELFESPHHRGQAADWQGSVLGQGAAVARELVKGMGGDVRYFHTDGLNSCELTLRKQGGGASRRRQLPNFSTDSQSSLPTRDDIAGLLEGKTMTMVYQPIVDIRSGGSGEAAVVGYESLARFPFSSPQHWFETAGSAGMGVDLELLAIRAAIETFASRDPGRFLALNLSNATLLSPQLTSAIDGIDPGRLVLELSDTARIRSYEVTRRAVEALRQRGVRLAVDDVGAGEIDMWHILRLDPEIIKIDRNLVADANVRRNDALIHGLTTMARDLGVIVVAEAIETELERQRLLQLGVEFGQGYLFGKPKALEWKSRVLGDSTH